MRRIDDDPRVREANARITEAQHAVNRAEAELAEMGRAAAAANNDALEAQANAMIGDADEDAAGEALAAAQAAADATAEKDREIEVRKLALRKLETKLARVRGEVRQELAAELAAEHRAHMQALVDALPTAQAAVEALREVERAYEPNGLELPPFALRAPSAGVAITNSGSVKFAAEDLLERAKNNGFLPEQATPAKAA